MLNPHLSRRPISRQLRAATLVAVLAAALPIALFAQNRFSTVSGSIVASATAASSPAMACASALARWAWLE